MMPGSHGGPPNFHHGPGRRQHEYAYHYPAQVHPQTHPYAAYPQQPIYYHPQAYPQHAYMPHHAQHWYPPHLTQPYSQMQRPPYQAHSSMTHQHHAPVIVSSHPPPLQPQSQAQVQSPSASFTTAPPSYRTNSSTPQAIPVQTPQPLPSTPSIASQTQASPATPTTSISTSTPPPSLPFRLEPASQSEVVPPRSSQPPKLPWYSVPEEPFPPRARRRRRFRPLRSSTATLELPFREVQDAPDSTPSTSAAIAQEPSTTPKAEETKFLANSSDRRSDTKALTEVVQDTVSSQSVAANSEPASSRNTQSVQPAIPVVPVVPRPVASTQAPSKTLDTGLTDIETASDSNTDNNGAAESSTETENVAVSSASPVTAPRALPKSWADLVRRQNAAAGVNSPANSNGVDLIDHMEQRSKASSLAEAIRAFSVDGVNKISFTEPRGLINTGNMCYMNSVLQVLVFCNPFYDFLDQIGKQAVHSFKSDTPLLDAMIMFMREFKVIDAAASPEKLRMRLKETELEQYGDAFIPEFAYDVIKRLPRFASMKRGHQQDAEEFLGFLLEGLHDECAHLLRSLPSSLTDHSEVTSPVSEHSSLADGGWHEVGPKQKAAVTRSSGHINLDSPITKIFGGKLRSEFRVPGLKNSVTLEPYQPLQLDISAPEVHNIVDALKGLTKSEILHGDFNSPRGPGTTATKQVFIESMPPVLILHLKRFHYDNAGGAQKIWKKLGYPLDLTIPKEVFATHKRAQMQISGLPQYRLISVVYHHGKNANGGHYTVDVRRQDGREWIRLDDTIIRRVRSEDVAAGGAEEDPKVLAKALEQHKRDTVPARNIYEQFDGEDHEGSEAGEWNQVANISKEKDAPTKKWSAVANGTTTPTQIGRKTPKYENAKDNKVAYLLFYRRMA